MYDEKSLNVEKTYSPNMQLSLALQEMVNIFAFVLQTHKVLSLTDQRAIISYINIDKKQQK